MTASNTGPTRVHVLGAGPVGLLTSALLQSNDRFSVHLYEKRREYTRTRMVQLASYLVADSVASYCADYVDGESVEAIFEPAELAEGITFRQSISGDLMALLRGWTQGFVPLNDIERGLSELLDSRTTTPIRRTSGVVTLEDLRGLLQPGDVVIDCTGTRSLLRGALLPGIGEQDEANTFKLRLEYALVVTFLYGQPYDCNEYCKYYKNADNPNYKFIPAVNRTCYDGRITHVTGIVNIPVEYFERMPSKFDGTWLRANFPEVALSMDRFIQKIHDETNGEILGDLEIIRIPLDLYRARNVTSRRIQRAGANGSPLAQNPAFLTGDSALGSPYFQSISLGFECAIFLAGLLGRQDLGLSEMQDQYEQYTYKQWLRVYMRSKMIKHNKDLFERVGDTMALLEKLHIY